MTLWYNLACGQNWMEIIVLFHSLWFHHFYLYFDLDGIKLYHFAYLLSCFVLLLIFTKYKTQLIFCFVLFCYYLTFPSNVTFKCMDRVNLWLPHLYPQTIFRKKVIYQYFSSSRFDSKLFKQQMKRVPSRLEVEMIDKWIVSFLSNYKNQFVSKVLFWL
jgi:hypothetical protein